MKRKMLLQNSAAKPERLFELNPILDPKFRLSRVGLALRVKKWVQSSWPQIGFKFRFDPIMYINISSVVEF